MTAADIAIIVSELGPIIKSYVDQATTTLATRNKDLELRLLEIETRPEPIRPDRGERGEPGQKGETGVSVASLMIDADHRLIAMLTDGRIQDVGPVPKGLQGERGDAGARGDMGLSGKDGAEGLAGKDGRDGIDGKDAAPVDVQAIVTAVLAQLPAPVPGERGAVGPVGPIGPVGPSGDRGEKGLDGAPGRDAAAIDVDALVIRVAALVPAGKDGKDAQAVDVDALVKRIAPLVPAGKDGAPGLTGKDADPVDVEALVTRVVAMIPTPKDGRDGVGVMDAVQDRQGHLVLTLSDGRTKDVGLVVGKDGLDGVGKDGAPGADGRSVELSEVQMLIAKELATWPRPKDGRDGVDGTDGLGFDEIDLVFDDEKGYAFRLTRGDRVKEFPVPWPWDAQVWQAGRQYVKAASVTWDGHFWIAQRDTTEPPGEGSSAWRLAVRRGKPGKEGKPGKDAPALRTTNTPPLYGQY